LVRDACLCQLGYPAVVESGGGGIRTRTVGHPRFNRVINLSLHACAEGIIPDAPRKRKSPGRATLLPGPVGNGVFPCAAVNATPMD
jgi:hypothetical protein